MIAGTKGYRDNVELFSDACLALDFEQVCKDFISYLPAPGAFVLDLGAGVGQNAAALHTLGYKVVAVEPVEEFIDVAKRSFCHATVLWLCDAMPELTQLNSIRAKFNFVLIEGVWHHLSESERVNTVQRLANLIAPKGKCAISLRNGPAGVGIRVYSTCVDETISQFNNVGFQLRFCRCDQDSHLPGKEEVKWSRLVFQKC